VKFQILLAAVMTLSVGVAQAATAPAKAPPKGVKCGDSYIAAGKTCTKAPPKPVAKGVPCGDSFIAAGQVCHKPTTAPAKTAMMAPAKPAAAPKPMMAKPMAKPAMAAKGKKCGNSYIAANAVCTKK
jgi:hypothetical protein